MLTTKYTQEQYAGAIDNALWTHLPPYADEKFWCDEVAQNKAYVDKVMHCADVATAAEWPELPQELYDEYQRNGNRDNFEGPYFRRRKNLAAWCIAECIERKGRYLALIAERVHSVIEENTWCLPAHVDNAPPECHAGDMPVVDLFAAETAMLLSSLWSCIGSQLLRVNPNLGGDIADAVEHRVLLPVESRTQYGWLEGRNNWGPWCASNCLIAAALLWQDPERYARFAYYLSECIDKFIAHYGEDGGCDEGPGYWAKAAGAMFIFLECLHGCSAGAMSIFENKKITNMATFIQHAHIGGNWFINFADAQAQMLPNYSLIYQFGKRCQSDGLMNFAQEIYALQQCETLDKTMTTSVYLEGVVSEFLWFKPQVEIKPLSAPSCVFLGDTEICIARECTENNTGFVLAAKGGHNAESHNHNDVGHFVLFHDAQPLIIDVGVGVYTRETFSSARYGLWHIAAESHNPPIINGIMQQDGEQYRARNFSLDNVDNVDNVDSVDDVDNSEASSTLSLSLLGAYENQAGCTAIDRSCTLQRGDQARVIIQDSAQSEQEISDYEIRLISPRAVQVQDSSVIFSDTDVRLHFNVSSFMCTITEKTIDDAMLVRQWGETLWIITFTLRNPATDIQSELVFRE